MTDIEPLLVAYADGELDGAAAAEVERILAENEDARRSVAIYRETAALLRAACNASVYADGANPLLRPSREPRPLRWRVPLAIAASVLLLLIGYGGALLTAPGDDQDSFIDDVAEYHEVYSHETTHLVEVPAAQSDEISRWLGARLQRPIDPPDLRTEGLRFAGARLWISDGKPVADLLYTRADGLPIAICIVHAVANDVPKAGRQEIAVTTREGLHVAFWQDRGYTSAVVGELSPEQARTIAEQARRSGV